ncbi:polysaccharide pyruvyl transferase CsaB [Candidatus Synechococcus calcipolaris G9]|uniref:Polysaccharide pyruvyl transferase CsaB n=1 Tax=Candidatus Synechococcus calcipolaris G9 TaxID=1497997 RepID=A0ABT6EWQ5_9SYNE|nr:polysaccharide pyruvyl transferase CsaB [Candidatus Synechococcus calcipolaris]MDG2990193.1 polysaccharide pyruvyl transferase CsaB [Candidatus Synechococcus calcipolaris G9]
MSLSPPESSSPIRVLLCGYYGYGNGGDEALLATLLQMLPASVTPIVLTSDPTTTAALHGVDTCDRRDWRKLLKLLGQCDGFIWGGGSLIQDVTSWRSPLYYLGLMALAQGSGAITLAWGQGIGPLRSPLNQMLTKHLLKNCRAVTVRDDTSGALLTRWRIPYTQGADPVWALDGVPVSLDNLPSPRIALSLRSHRTLTPERLGVLCQALDQFQQITQAFILLLPFQKSQDLAIAEEIHAFLGDRATTKDALPSQRSQILILENPRDLKGVFATIDFAIAMRLHALIMAAAEGCPCFALSYDPKVTSLMTELNLPGLEMTELPMEPTHLAHHWTRAYSQGAIAPNQRQTLRTSALNHQRILETITTKKRAIS